MNTENKYDRNIITAILNDKVNNITEVNDLVSIKTMFFNRNQYPIITSLIKESDFDSLLTLNSTMGVFAEYLDLIKFTDQQNNPYLVTIYDSDELWQDPQIIDIFPLFKRQVSS